MVTLMRPSTIAKLAALAVSVIVATGCAAPTEEITASVASTAQADTVTVGPGGILAAIELAKMISNYQTYGSPVVNNALLLEKIDATQKDLQDLEAATTRLQNQVNQLNSAILGTDTIDKLNAIAQVHSEYWTAAKKGQTSVNTVLTKLETSNRLSWVDLDNLQSVFVDKGLFSAVARVQASAGVAGTTADVLGSYFVHVSLLQEQAFFVLAERDAKKSGFDVAAQRAKQDQRRRERTDAFVVAMNVYYAGVAKVEADARVANIGECVCTDPRGLGQGCVITPELVQWSYADTNAYPNNGTGGWMDGKSACETSRTGYIAQRTTDTSRELFAAVFANAKGFRAWADAMVKDDNSIKVLTSSYGPLGGGANDITAQIANACNGKRECSFKVDNTALGDPRTEGASNILSGVYRCDNGTIADIAQKSFRIEGAEDGTVVTLSCPAVAGNVDRLVGRYVDLKADASNAWAKVTITKATSSVVKWTNDADMFWGLSLSPDATVLDASPDAAYYQNGYKQYQVKLDAAGKVTGIVGPFGILYSRVAQ